MEASESKAEGQPQAQHTEHKHHGQPKSKGRSGVVNFLLVFGLCYLSLRYIWPSVSSVHWAVTADKVQFHSNSTHDLRQISAHLHSLTKTLQVPTVRVADISLAMSNMNADDVDDFIPGGLGHIREIKLNFANTNIGNKGAEYLVNILPLSLEELDLSLDAVNGDEQLGKIVGTSLARLTNLRDLRLSFILSKLKDEGLASLLDGLKGLSQLQNLSLVLMANELTAQSAKPIQSFLERMTQLEGLELCLFTNQLGAEGAAPIAEGLSKLQNLRRLDLDFYFNNLTEVGTQHIAQGLERLTNLRSLRLNLDFNYIKNEGGKAVAGALQKLSSLAELNLGVAQKNFGYLGFKDIVKSIEHLAGLKKLTLRCGVNRVGVNGAHAIADLFTKVTQLEELHLGLVESYFGVEGAVLITKSIVDNLKHLQQAHLDYGFNDIKGHGLPEVLRLLATAKFERLFLSLSNNELKDADAKELSPYFKRLLRTHGKFELDFLNTAVSAKGKAEVERAFKWRSHQVHVNNIPLTDEHKASNHPEDINLDDEVESIDEQRIHAQDKATAARAEQASRTAQEQASKAEEARKE